MKLCRLSSTVCSVQVDSVQIKGDAGGLRKWNTSEALTRFSCATCGCLVYSELSGDEARRVGTSCAVCGSLHLHFLVLCRLLKVWRKQGMAGVWPCLILRDCVRQPGLV